jgi:hypothetical protein
VIGAVWERGPRGSSGHGWRGLRQPLTGSAQAPLEAQGKSSTMADNLQATLGTTSRISNALSFRRKEARKMRKGPFLPLGFVWRELGL